MIERERERLVREHFEHETELTTERRKYASLIENERVNRWGGRR